MNIRQVIRKGLTWTFSSIGATFTRPPFWTQLETGVTAHSGVSLTNQSALGITAYYSGVTQIAQTVAQLPLILYTRETKGKSRAVDHQLYSLLHDEPNEYMTSFTFRETLQGHLLTWGNAFAEIGWDMSGREPVAESLFPLRPDRMQLTWENKRLVYVYSVAGEQVKLLPYQVLHIPGFGFDGLIGYDPITLFKESLGLSKAAEEFGARFFANGSALNGVLQHPGPARLSKEATELMRTSWEQMHKGLSRSHKVAILQEGVTYKDVGIPPENAQFMELRNFQVLEVARMLHIPPHKLAHLADATFSNIEHQNIEYVVDTIQPHLVRWEQEIHRKLLAPSEKKKYYAEFLVDGLLRGDTQSRYQAYSVGRQWGWLSANDVRSMENMNPIEGGDLYMVPLNMMSADLAIDEPSETGAVAPIGAEGDTAENIAEGEKLNGAQITAATSVITDLVNGLIPATVALELLVAVGIDRERAQSMIDACEGFTPTAPPTEPQKAKLLKMLEPDTKAKGRKLAMLRSRQAARFRGKFVAAMAPVVKQEMADVAKAAKQHLGAKSRKDFNSWLNQYYTSDFKAYIVKHMTPVMVALAEAIWPLAASETGNKDPLDEAKLKAYIDGFADRYAEIHRYQATEAAKTETITDMLDKWGDVAAQKVADAESVGLANVMAKLAFGAAVTQYTWHAIGAETCPICEEWDGVKVTTAAPPLHDGCVCQLGPG